MTTLEKRIEARGMKLGLLISASDLYEISSNLSKACDGTNNNAVDSAIKEYFLI